MVIFLKARSLLWADRCFQPCMSSTIPNPSILPLAVCGNTLHAWQRLECSGRALPGSYVLCAGATRGGRSRSQSPTARRFSLASPHPRRRCGGLCQCRIRGRADSSAALSVSRDRVTIDRRCGATSEDREYVAVSASKCPEEHHSPHLRDALFQTRSHARSLLLRPGRRL
jgi:hypothetical protein